MDRFISCDWGSSSFRLRLVDSGKKEILSEVLSDKGIAETYQNWMAAGLPATERSRFYTDILAAAIVQLSGSIDRDTPVIASGMISSSMGLAELPYREFPFNWDLSQFGVKKMEGNEYFTHPVYLVSGFKTDDDVMRGEETLLLGCDAGDDSEKIFIFPGTHSKHVFVKNKSANDFKTFMTGELFNLLAEKSILRNAVIKGTDEKSFVEGCKAGLDGNILHHIFKVRTRQLLDQKNPVSNYQFLSGLLIGTELRNLREKDCDVYLVSSGHLRKAYLLALESVVLRGNINELNMEDVLINAHCIMASQFFK